jgi:hypothetical protein
LEGEEVAGPETLVSAYGTPRLRLKTSLVMSVEKTRRVRETNQNNYSTIKLFVRAIKTTNT